MRSEGSTTRTLHAGSLSTKASATISALYSAHGCDVASLSLDSSRTLSQNARILRGRRG